MLQETAPEEGALQSVRTTRVLVSKAPGSVNPFIFPCTHVSFSHRSDSPRTPENTVLDPSRQSTPSSCRRHKI